MNVLYSCVPTINEEFANQTEATNISDEEFDRQIKEPRFTWYQRLFQVICFIIFLGPIRMVLSTIFFCIFLVLCVVYRIILNSIGMKDKGKYLGVKLAALAFRFLMFGFGHAFIRVEGEFDPEARAIIANHTGFSDPYVVIWIKAVSCVMKKELANLSFMKYVFENADPVYVDRKVQSGATKTIISHMENPKVLPILIFPEGTITNGDILLDFHHSAFLTDKKVQPMTIRYWMSLVPKGWNSYAWTTRSTIEHFWLLFSMPPSLITIHILPAISKSVEGEGSVEIFAKKAQLIMANDLKVRACLRNSNEIFRKQKPEKEAQANLQATTQESQKDK